MEPYTLHIRNMVCPRCIKVVTEELERLGLPVLEVHLGTVLLQSEPAPAVLAQLREALAGNGFELLEDQKAELVERIKINIIELVRDGGLEDLQENLSDYLEKAIGRDYAYLSSLFSAAENTTIARYLVLQKVERAKELLAYNEFSLSQIAYQLGYSSVAHLSNQFKQVTGVTPTEFKKSDTPTRKPLDQVQ